MSAKDYSQWGEQKIVREFFAGQTGSFLDIGANDGVTDSNTASLADDGWSGLCIEPSVYAFSKLVEARRDNPKVACLQAAIAPSVALYRFFDTLSGVATIIPHARCMQHVRKEYFVAGVNPEIITQKFGCSWDFVSIDIEGFEPEVVPLCGILFSGTKLICFEDNPPFVEPFDERYYQTMIGMLGELGFKSIVARTFNSQGYPANTFISR